MRITRPTLLGLLLAVAACDSAPGHPYPATDADRDGVPATQDCDDADPGAWRTAQAYRDGDGDGLGTGPLLTLCAGARLPAGYATVAGDCDDADPRVWRTVQAYRDADGDGFGAGPLLTLCAGDSLPAGHAT